MPVSIVDASAVAAVLLVEPEAEAIAERLGDSELAAPDLIEFKVGNVCWKRAQREPAKAEFYRQAMREFAALILPIYAIDAQAVWQLAYQTRLTFYDASYLWLATNLQAELVTLDRALARAHGRLQLRRVEHSNISCEDFDRWRATLAACRAIRTESPNSCIR